MLRFGLRSYKATVFYRKRQVLALEEKSPKA
ncbi:hypothetical protein SGRA_3787 [Saprospira grandis str. Lewin]|uniref:Uncharacterized protein n=1 Tax=Saprospira grandis (strain Lewin) TaxID=984262 RepID=H6L8D9_SAPGL|nr:hypothetical protein SGRA_3787 [Saprospira grandis str. Lewin]